MAVCRLAMQSAAAQPSLVAKPWMAHLLSLQWVTDDVQKQAGQHKPKQAQSASACLVDELVDHVPEPSIGELKGRQESVKPT